LFFSAFVWRSEATSCALYRSRIPIPSYALCFFHHSLSQDEFADTKQPPYAVSNSFIVLAPLFIGAGNYLLITRLCRRVLPTHITHIHRIPVGRLTRIFVICDIISFLIQVSGSGIASSGNWQGSTVKIGTDVLIVGLATQVVTFAFFVGIVGRFHHLTRQGEVKDDAGRGWRLVLKAVYISSALIIVSSTGHD
jgi:hypothetical protein